MMFAMNDDVCNVFLGLYLLFLQTYFYRPIFNDMGLL